MFASNVKSVIGAKVITNVISSMKSPATLPNKPIIVSIDKIHQIIKLIDEERICIANGVWK